jgi:hypothetical protein
VTTGSVASTATTRSGAVGATTSSTAGTGDDHVFGEDGDDIVNTKDTVQGNDLADGGQGAADSCRTDPGDQTVRCP